MIYRSKRCGTVKLGYEKEDFSRKEGNLEHRTLGRKRILKSKLKNILASKRRTWVELQEKRHCQTECRSIRMKSPRMCVYLDRAGKKLPCVSRKHLLPTSALGCLHCLHLQNYNSVDTQESITLLFFYPKHHDFYSKLN